MIAPALTQHARHSEGKAFGEPGFLIADTGQ